MRYFHWTALLLVLFLHSSCVRYQFYSFTSDKLTITSDNGFVEELKEDSISISYRWQNNSAYIEVHNLSHQLVRIDWSRSALIFNDLKQDVYNKTVQTTGTGTFNGTVLQWGDGGLDTFDGNISLNTTTATTTSQNAVFPRSKSLYELPDPVLRYYQYGGSSTNTPLKSRIVPLPTQTKVRLREGSFDKTNTPLKMRSILTYQIGNSPAARQVEQEFWIHQVVETYNRRAMAKLQNTNRTEGLDKNLKNKLVRAKYTNYRTFAHVTAVLGSIGAILWLVSTGELNE